MSSSAPNGIPRGQNDLAASPSASLSKLGQQHRDQVEPQLQGRRQKHGVHHGLVWADLWQHYEGQRAGNHQDIGQPEEVGKPGSAFALDVGYESPAAFSRAFKKQIDVSPAAWRNRVSQTGSKRFFDAPT
jgi:AraC-like DNA-binding protein